MKWQTLILFVFITAYNLAGQNLVPNGSFEEFTECPEEYVTNKVLNTVKYWTSPNNGTPDYFNACSYKCGVPYNWVGNAEAFDGKGYMGLIACMRQIDPKQIAYREYIRIELQDSLAKDKKYYAEMWVRLGLTSLVACNGLGMFFSELPMNSYETINYPVKADIVYPHNDIIYDKNGWTRICGVYHAKGNEKYLIIGNFLSNQQMEYRNFDENLIPTPNINPMAYYYIDGVLLEPYNDSLHYDCANLLAEEPKEFNGEIFPHQRMILKNLYFETDKAVILEESYQELDRLVYELKRNPNLKISIFGHTDNIGTDEYNQELSEQRASAVRNYLLEKGISRFRIVAKGFGKSQPISENETEEGRQLNRRVEIEVN